MARYLVSAGWPYLYDVPGLHNLVPMLFADAAARFLRYEGHEVFYLTGGDEHGSRVEFVAEGHGVSPRELVDRKYGETKEALAGMGLSLDRFGRTSDPGHVLFVQEFFRDLARRGALVEKPCRVPFCAGCGKFIPDRFVEGRCPHCGEKAYGNQCNNKKDCGRILEPAALRETRCAVCGGAVELRETAHLVFPLARYAREATAGVRGAGGFEDEVRAIVEETIASAPEIVVTRDGTWGISDFGFRISDFGGERTGEAESSGSEAGKRGGPDRAPALPGDPNPKTEIRNPKSKIVYNWVDSLLAKVSSTTALGPEGEERFWKDPEANKLFFLGKDGVAFYGVLFPALLLASGRGYALSNWQIVPNEVFIYEGGVCSKSTGTGIWLKEALATLPGDFWRFTVYQAQSRVDAPAPVLAPSPGSRNPEPTTQNPPQKDIDFRWDRFCEAVNRDLIAAVGAWVEACSFVQHDARALLPPEGGRRLEEAAADLGAFRFGPAFGGLVEIAAAAAEDVGTGRTQDSAILFSVLRNSRALLEKFLPLLGCFLPDLSSRAWKRLGARRDLGEIKKGRTVLYSREIALPSTPLFPFDRLVAGEAELAYNKKVADRRGTLTLNEEITNARADEVCVCPVNLREL